MVAYRVTWTTRDNGSYAYETEEYSTLFADKEDAWAFYQTLNDYVRKVTNGKSYLENKYYPRKEDLTLFKYDKENLKLNEIK